MSAQLDRLSRRLKAIPKAARDAVQPDLDKSTAELVDRMRSLAPKDSGDLKDSIHSEHGDTELQRKVIAGDGEAFYGRWVEFGTSDTPAQPFFYPAYRLLKKRIQNRLKRSVAKAIKREFIK